LRQDSLFIESERVILYGGSAIHSPSLDQDSKEIATSPIESNMNLTQTTTFGAASPGVKVNFNVNAAEVTNILPYKPKNRAGRHVRG